MFLVTTEIGELIAKRARRVRTNNSKAKRSENLPQKPDKKEVGGEAADSSRQQHISADNREKAKGYFPPLMSLSPRA
jgi:hypothetical protein